ncbi:MAG: CNT family concentrative nucleoside transporter, partial [Planctomycetota bacterium]
AAAGTVDIGIVSFAFKALPTILYFSAAMAILYHLGIMQRVIWLLAAFMTKLMRVSGAESLAMAANVFVGQTEAPLVVRPYVPKMTRSELMAMMTGGFATIAGSVLAVYIGILGTDFAGHLLAASFMSAPAAFVIAKIMVPETEVSTTAGTVSLLKDDDENRPVNVLDAAAAGTSDGLKLYLNVLAMLIAFVSLVALIDAGLGLIDVQGTALSLSRIFGWLFSPVAWMMGVEWSDCQNFGTLLGTKVAVNEFIAFGSMADMQANATLSPRSLEMAAYALCGFANFSSIGIQIGGITPLAPERRGEIASLAMRAMIGGAFASWMTATIAGAFL